MEGGEAPAQTCIYCLSDRELTEDHVPPECLFDDVPRVELIAVPSCRKCNGMFARDDEFLRDIIVAATAGRNMPELVAPRAAMQRSLARTKFAGPIKGMLKRARYTWASIGGSQILQPATALPVNSKRLHNVVQRIVRGLFFHETGRVIPPDYQITVADPNLLRTVASYDRPYFQNLIGAAFAGKERAVGGRRFGYSYHVLRDDPLASVWLLSFLGALIFFCTAAKRGP